MVSEHKPAQTRVGRLTPQVQALAGILAVAVVTEARALAVAAVLVTMIEARVLPLEHKYGFI